MDDTIFALSSGAPPAAIGIIRISGPHAHASLKALTDREIPYRKPVLARLINPQGDLLDEALVLSFDGPNTATGEDLVELHCHGGRAVIAAVETALGRMEGLRRAEAGEFTRRAFANNRLDLAEAEGLGDLLAAETELQRASAIRMADGNVSRETHKWRLEILRLSAMVEAALDFSDEDDVNELPSDFATAVAALRSKLADWLKRPQAEVLRDGFRVVLAGPPNSGKSTLFNRLVASEAAITSPIPGTTRDIIARSVAIEGVPFTFIDTAGLRAESSDPIELIGIERAHAELERAGLVLWLGEEGQGPEGSLEIAARADIPAMERKSGGAIAVSAVTGDGIPKLTNRLLETAQSALPRAGEVAINARQRVCIARAYDALQRIEMTDDPLLIGEELRMARSAFDDLLGRTGTEDMLDTLFGRFCIGK